MTRFDVVGFGALNVDKLYKVNRIAHAEEESFIEAHEESCGGSAANTVVGLARLGCRVGFIGKTGMDREGNMLIDDFEREGVDTSGIMRAKFGESGSVLGFVDEAGQRALYIDSGVNDTIAIEEVKADVWHNTEFLHLTSFVGEKSFDTQKQLVEARPSDVRISFDPGALYAKRGMQQLEPIIRNSYVMMPNARELALITGEKDIERGANILLSKGVKVVAVKLGAEGCYVTDGKEGHHLQALNVDVVDTTGAGDAFCAGFLFGLLNNRSLADCGKLGNFVASRCVMQLGARPGLPYLENLGSLR